MLVMVREKLLPGPIIGLVQADELKGVAVWAKPS